MKTLAKHSKIVVGKIKDGADETSGEEYLTKKVNDIISTASTVYAVSITRLGSGIWAAALVCYEA